MDVTVLLILIRTLLPIPAFQGAIRLACPLPFVLLALRRGPRIGLLASLSSYILLSCFIGPVVANQILVFGGLGTLFAWASQRKMPEWLTVLIGALLYGVGYLLIPFLIGLAALHVSLSRTLGDVKRQAGGFVAGLGHLHLLSFNVGAMVVRGLSQLGPGRALLNLLHWVGLGLLTHPLATLIGFFAAYSILNVGVYLVIATELFHRLPPEARRDARGETIDFFRRRYI